MFHIKALNIIRGIKKVCLYKFLYSPDHALIMKNVLSCLFYPLKEIHSKNQGSDFCKVEASNKTASLTRFLIYFDMSDDFKKIKTLAA